MFTKKMEILLQNGKVFVPLQAIMPRRLGQVGYEMAPPRGENPKEQRIKKCT